jgi:hypothetical protein
LPSARQKVLDKETAADVQFAERYLPSVTLGKLGKAFAECKIAFAECLRHTANELIPVVTLRQVVGSANSSRRTLRLSVSISGQVMHACADEVLASRLVFVVLQYTAGGRARTTALAVHCSTMHARHARVVYMLAARTLLLLASLLLALVPIQLATLQRQLQRRVGACLQLCVLPGPVPSTYVRPPPASACTHAPERSFLRWSGQEHNLHTTPSPCSFFVTCAARVCIFVAVVLAARDGGGVGLHSIGGNSVFGVQNQSGPTTTGLNFSLLPNLSYFT